VSIKSVSLFENPRSENGGILVLVWPHFKEPICELQFLAWQATLLDNCFELRPQARATVPATS
ncbi:MAG: hypothetical protein ACI93T_000789, partial [Porticoccaceae bacterium]